MMQAMSEPENAKLESPVGVTGERNFVSGSICYSVRLLPEQSNEKRK